jgi:hypothetical protein
MFNSKMVYALPCNDTGIYSKGIDEIYMYT